MKIDGHGDHVRMLQSKANNPKALATSYQMPKMVSNSKVSFLDLNSMDIARQICLKVYPTFCAIQVSTAASTPPLAFLVAPFRHR